MVNILTIVMIFLAFLILTHYIYADVYPKYTDEYRAGYIDYPNSDTYDKIQNDLHQNGPLDTNEYYYKRGWEAARSDSIDKSAKSAIRDRLNQTNKT